MNVDAEDVTPGWRFVWIGVEGNAVHIDGVNPWRVNWTATARRIVVPHPSYPAQRHQLEVYEITGSDPPVVFAAGELSNGVWGFFVPA